MGAAAGAVSGAAAERAPQVTRGAGIPFGVVFWLAADQIVVPALGFSKKPARHPLSLHGSGLLSHFVHGSTTEYFRHRPRSTA